MANAILKAFSAYKLEVEDVIPPDVIATGTGGNPAGKNETTNKPAATSSSMDTMKVAYRIQIAASSKSTIDARYQSLEDLEIIKEDDLYKFLVGRFTSAEAARPRLIALKADGFEGAFIVAYYNGKRVRAWKEKTDKYNPAMRQGINFARLN